MSNAFAPALKRLFLPLAAVALLLTGAVTAIGLASPAAAHHPWDTRRAYPMDVNLGSAKKPFRLKTAGLALTLQDGYMWSSDDAWTYDVRSLDKFELAVFVTDHTTGRRYAKACTGAPFAKFGDSVVCNLRIKSVPGHTYTASSRICLNFRDDRVRTDRCSAFSRTLSLRTH